VVVEKWMVKALAGVATRDRGVPHEQVVAELAVPHRAGAAYWLLLSRGEAVLDAVLAGLRDEHPDVRYHCARMLDHLLVPKAVSELLSVLGDPDPRVRRAALHSLACDRCKAGDCRPDAAVVLADALRLLVEDLDPGVRMMAAEVAGLYVHQSPQARQALTRAVTTDPSAAVRKKIRWYLPGGPIYQRTAPTTRLAAR
jgi:HEAT repeat protein